MDRDWDLAEEMEQEYEAGFESGAEAERERIAEWLRSHEAGRITAGAGNDPWYAAGKLADAIEAGHAR